jgi:hypothetical protein
MKTYFERKYQIWTANMERNYGKKLGIESGPKARAGGLCPPQTKPFSFILKVFGFLSKTFSKIIIERYIYRNENIL